MQYRTLGRTGIKVSPYALGALSISTRLGNAEEESIRIIHKALDSGINLIDTADAYLDSEEIVGQALKGRRDDVVLATKVSRPMGSDPNQQGASRRWIVTAVENSLRRLQTNHIDIYQVHRPDPDTDIEETLSVMTDLVRSGKIRAFGTSTLPASISWRRTGSRNDAASSAPGPNSRRTPSSPGASNARSSPSHSSTGWASSSGDRSHKACSPAESVADRTATSSAGRRWPRSATSGALTWWSS